MDGLPLHRARQHVKALNRRPALESLPCAPSMADPAYLYV